MLYKYIYKKGINIYIYIYIHIQEHHHLYFNIIKRFSGFLYIYSFKNNNYSF